MLNLLMGVRKKRLTKLYPSDPPHFHEGLIVSSLGFLSSCSLDQYCNTNTENRSFINKLCWICYNKQGKAELNEHILRINVHSILYIRIQFIKLSGTQIIVVEPNKLSLKGRVWKLIEWLFRIKVASARHINQQTRAKCHNYTQDVDGDWPRSYLS